MKFPVELLLNLAKHLNMRELIEWRQICKEWKCFIDEFCLDELILFINFYPTLELWKITGQPIDLQKAIVLTSDRCLSDSGFRYTLRNLKRLFLVVKKNEKAYYKLDFPKLEHLEITRHNSRLDNHFNFDGSYLYEPGLMMPCNADFELNFPNLKTLYVNVFCAGIVLNCPKLSELSFHLNYPRFQRPVTYQHYSLCKQIRKLTCSYDCEWIKELENLESLTCHYSSLRFRPPGFLKCFPRLKFLYAYGCSADLASLVEEEKVRLGRTEVKSFYFGKIGLEFFNAYWISWLNCAIFDCYHVIARYLGDDLTKLAPTLPSAFTLHYNESFRSYKRDFYAKLTNVQALSITQGSVTQAELAQLIGWLKNIVILWMNEARGLDQAFYECLPVHHPYLRVINIDNRDLTDLDLNFLLRLDHLYRVEFKNQLAAEKCLHYGQLVEKVRAKKEEIAKISGKVLFESDELKFEVDLVEQFDIKKEQMARQLQRQGRLI